MNIENRPRRVREVLNVAANLLLVILVGTFLFLPGGPGWQLIAGWRANRATSQEVASVWPALIRSRSLLGGRDATVRLVEFMDYACLHCANADAILSDLLARDSNLAVAVRHFPLAGIDSWSGQAAKAAICAEVQDRFPEMHQRLLAAMARSGEPDWPGEAEQARVADLGAFSQCMNSDWARERVQADINFGRQLGIRGTPTFVHPGGILQGERNEGELEGVTSR